MEAISKVINANILASIIDLPWQLEDTQVEVIVTPLNKSDANIDTSPKITDLKGIYKAFRAKDFLGKIK
jgi:hypothetical protein